MTTGTMVEVQKLAAKHGLKAYVGRATNFIGERKFYARAHAADGELIVIRSSPKRREALTALAQELRAMKRSRKAA